MMDEIFDRNYQAGRAALNADIDKAVHGVARTVGDAMRALHRLEWNAPWARQVRRPD